VIPEVEGGRKDKEKESGRGDEKDGQDATIGCCSISSQARANTSVSQFEAWLLTAGYIV